MKTKFKALLGIIIVIAAIGGYMLLSGDDEKPNGGGVPPNVTQPMENATTNATTNVSMPTENQTAQNNFSGANGSVVPPDGGSTTPGDNKTILTTKKITSSDEAIALVKEKYSDVSNIEKCQFDESWMCHQDIVVQADIQRDPDRHLDHHREAGQHLPGRVDPVLPIELHGLLAQLLPVILVLLL